MAIWTRQASAPQTAPLDNTPPAAAAPTPATHSLIAGNGQHYVSPARTGGQPWIGQASGGVPQAHPFGPAEGFEPASGFGVSIAAPSLGVVRRTAAAQNQITGVAAGRHQLTPGGGVNLPSVQVSGG